MLRVLITIAALAAALPASAVEMQKVATTDAAAKAKPFDLAQLVSTYTLIDRFESPEAWIRVAQYSDDGTCSVPKLRESCPRATLLVSTRDGLQPGRALFAYKEAVVKWSRVEWFKLVDGAHNTSTIFVTGCTVVGARDKQELRERRYKIDVSLDRAQIEPMEIGPPCDAGA